MCHILEVVIVVIGRLKSNDNLSSKKYHAKNEKISVAGYYVGNF